MLSEQECSCTWVSIPHLQGQEEEKEEGISSRYHIYWLSLRKNSYHKRRKTGTCTGLNLTRTNKGLWKRNESEAEKKNSRWKRYEKLYVRETLFEIGRFLCPCPWNQPNAPAHDSWTGWMCAHDPVMTGACGSMHDAPGAATRDARGLCHMSAKSLHSAVLLLLGGCCRDAPLSLPR